MLRLFRNKRAQNTAEYAILIAVVVGAAIAMQTYVKRGLQGRTHDETVKMYKDITGAKGWSKINPDRNPAILTSGQYEPEGLISKSTQEVVKDEETSRMFKGGRTQKDSITQTKQAEGDYQKYDYPQE